jgi:hypothetical protein
MDNAMTWMKMTISWRLMTHFKLTKGNLDDMDDIKHMDKS